MLKCVYVLRASGRTGGTCLRGAVNGTLLSKYCLAVFIIEFFAKNFASINSKISGHTVVKY